MLTREENELLTRTGPGTPMGHTMRRYWVPALLSWEVPEPDCPPVRVKLLGETLVAFRDPSGTGASYYNVRAIERIFPAAQSWREALLPEMYPEDRLAEVAR